MSKSIYVETKSNIVFQINNNRIYNSNTNITKFIKLTATVAVLPTSILILPRITSTEVVSDILSVDCCARLCSSSDENYYVVIHVNSNGAYSRHDTGNAAL